MDVDTLYKQIGKNIKKYRELKNLTQQELADKVNLGLNFIGKVEIAFSHPSLKTLCSIADALDIKIEKLFRFE